MQNSKLSLFFKQVCPPHHNGCQPQDPYFLVDPIQGIIMFDNNHVFKTENMLPMHCPQDVLFDRYLQPTIDASFEGTTEISKSTNIVCSRFQLHINMLLRL